MGTNSTGAAELELFPVEAHLRGLLRWFKEDAFVMVIAEWSWDWCLEFPRDPVTLTSVEHSLRFTEAHQQYRQLFETRAQEYLQLHGLREDNFLQLAVQCLDGASTRLDDVFEGLVASESYESFFKYMGMVRRRREFAERTLCSSSDQLDWVELVRRSLRRDLGDVTVGDASNVEFLD